MNRRAVLSLIGGASLLPIAARAQQKPMPVIGYLSPLSKEAETTIGFLAGLAGEGFVVGRNLAIEYRFADGHPDRLSPLATELARLPVAVLVASGAGAAVAAKEATSTIPIVFGSGPDPCNSASSQTSPAPAATQQE